MWAYTCGWRMSLRARIIDQDCELFTVKNGLIGIGTSRLVLRGSAIRAAYKEKAPHRRGALGKGIPVQQQRVRSVRLFYGGVRAASDEPMNRLCLFWVIKWRLRGVKPLPQKEAMEQLQGPPGQREHRGSPVFRDVSLCARLDNRPCGIFVTLGKCFCPITLLGNFPV